MSEEGNKKPSQPKESGLDQVSDYFQTVSTSDGNGSPESVELAEQEEQKLFSGEYNADNWFKHHEFRLKKANQESERKLREDNAQLAFKFSSIATGFIGLIVILKGFGAQFEFFLLSQTEFLSIIGTLTTLLIFYTVVLKHLFHRANTIDDKTKKGAKNNT